MFLKIIEAVSYAVTRGAIKAVWEELRKPRTAVNEEATDEDRIIESRLRGRFAEFLQGPGNFDGERRPEDSAQDRGEDGDQGLA